MPKASRFEREFVRYLSRYGVVGRFAGSGTLNTIVGDLVMIPPRASDITEPWVVEVKSTHKSVYYPSVSVELLSRLGRLFRFRPYLAVRFVNRGWKLIDISESVPSKVTPDGAEFFPLVNRTVWDWLRDLESEPSGPDS